MDERINRECWHEKTGYGRVYKIEDNFVFIFNGRLYKYPIEEVKIYNPENGVVLYEPDHIDTRKGYFCTLNYKDNSGFSLTFDEFVSLKNQITRFRRQI